MLDSQERNLKMSKERDENSEAEREKGEGRRARIEDVDK